MNKLPIAQMIAEAETWERGLQNDAARPGKGQSLAQLRLERVTGIISLLRWCRDNAEGLRAYRKATGQEATK